MTIGEDRARRELDIVMAFLGELKHDARVPPEVSSWAGNLLSWLDYEEREKQ